MDKVAFITGASRGIGRAVALRLARDGYKVAINCLQNRQMAEELRDTLLAEGCVAQVYPCDISDCIAVEAVAKQVERELGPVSVLVNNAGFAQQKLFTDTTPEEWRRMFAVHVDGAYNTCRAFLPGMIRCHEGCIVNLSSMWGQVGGSCEVAYSAAKAALLGLTKALAKEVGPAGIRVNAVAPGVIVTDMVKDLPSNVLDELAQEAPLCRLGAPEDVAATVAFLVSADASFITGQIIAPNGGIVI